MAMGDTIANFAIAIPDDANVKTKALLLAATILLDYEVFQERPPRGGGKRWEKTKKLSSQY